jgi:hypothetical protein
MRCSLCRSICVLLPLLLLPGCSFWAVRGPDRSVRGGGNCTTSPAAPVLDGVIGAGFVGMGIAGAGSPSCSGCWVDLSSAAHGAGAGLIALGVIEAAAATVGAIRAGACAEAKKELLTPPSRIEAAPSLDLSKTAGR